MPRCLIVLLCCLVPSNFTAAGPYPKLNQAIGYEVDPGWPKKPDHIQWKLMCGVAVDAEDNVWTLNANNPPVQVYDPEGNLLKTWGEGLFEAPHSIRFGPDDSVWIADYKTHTIRKFTRDGKLLLTLGTPGEAGMDEAHFNMPTDIAVTPSGDIFVTDGYGNNRIVHFDATGKFVKTWGELGIEAGEIMQPHHIVVDSKGLLYVAERNNCRIQVFDQEGNSLAEWRQLVNPWGLWMTPKDELYVCGSSPARWKEEWGNLGNPPTDALMMRFSLDGRAQQLWVFPLAGEDKTVPGEVDWVHGIAVDSKGNLYLGDVCDWSPSHRVQKFTRLAPVR